MGDAGAKVNLKVALGTIELEKKSGPILKPNLELRK